MITLSKMVLLNVTLCLGLLLHSPVQALGDWQFYDTGYGVAPKYIAQKLPLHKESTEAFLEIFETSKNRFPEVLGPKTTHLIKAVSFFVQQEQSGKFTNCKGCQDSSNQFEKANGQSYDELAYQIVKSSYCLGNDPFVIASKIRNESRFDMRAVSTTSAIGLTQLTNPAIAEVLDQLGHRGPSEAVPETAPYLKDSIRCFLDGETAAFADSFPKIETYVQKLSNKKTKVHYKSSTIQSFRRWLAVNSSDSAEMRAAKVRRQLLFGQIHFRIYLGVSKKMHPKYTTTQNYNEALQLYNGETRKVTIKGKKVLFKVLYAQNILNYALIAVQRYFHN